MREPCQTLAHIPFQKPLENRGSNLKGKRRRLDGIGMQSMKKLFEKKVEKCHWRRPGIVCISMAFIIVDCPLSKGNQAATPKIKRPNGKNT